MQTESSNSPGNMIHPSREEWMDFLYDESPASRRAELDAHLKSCPACELQVARWRNTMGALDADELSTPTAGKSITWSKWKWAAAAAFIIAAVGGGFGLGRASSPRDVQSLRAAIRSEMRGEMQAAMEEQRRGFAAALASVSSEAQRVLAEYTQAAEEKHLQERQTLLQTVQQLDASRQSEILSLRKDLETVALFTDDGLKKTEAQLFQLANYSQPQANP
jgi:anti-sigma factor RsiW